MKVVCWNVNSINSRLQYLVELVEEENPDIILLQEIKCEKSKFPYLELSNLNYNIEISGQKTYNGVAILSKYRIEEVNTDIPNNPLPQQARFIEITINTPLGLSKIISVYVPNGGEVGSEKFIDKITFLKVLHQYLDYLNSLSINILIGGDFNVAPFDIDVYDTQSLKDNTCFTLEERSQMREILNLPYIDLFRLQHPTSQEFSWWDYRGGSFQQNKGMRIDFILANSILTNFLESTSILRKYRGNKKPSDHAPISAILHTF